MAFPPGPERKLSGIDMAYAQMLRSLQTPHNWTLEIPPVLSESTSLSI
jgi:hypothetical protein